MLFVSLAFAQNIADECVGKVMPDDYDEQAQQDFLANYYALTFTMSPQHAPVPDDPGTGSVGIDLLGIPPLRCERRFVLGFSKTENTNVSPVAPRLRATFTFPPLFAGNTFAYAGVAYFPPVTIPVGELGIRNVLAGGEAGITQRFGRHDVGVRYHFQTSKTVGDTASAFAAEDPAVADWFQASSFGVDAMYGTEILGVRPYAALGLTNVSTFFYVGDDGVVANNLHPYFGPAFALGVDGKAESWFRWDVEFYGAPGGHAVPPGAPDPDPDAGNAYFGRYGRVYTLRLRFAVSPKVRKDDDRRRLDPPEPPSRRQEVPEGPEGPAPDGSAGPDTDPPT